MSTYRNSAEGIRNKGNKWLYREMGAESSAAHTHRNANKSAINGRITAARHADGELFKKPNSVIPFIAKFYDILYTKVTNNNNKKIIHLRNDPNIILWVEKVKYFQNLFVHSVNRSYFYFYKENFNSTPHEVPTAKTNDHRFNNKLDAFRRFAMGYTTKR